MLKLEEDEDLELASDMHRRVKSKMNKQYSSDMKLLRAAVGDSEKRQLAKSMKRLRDGVMKMNQEESDGKYISTIIRNTSDGVELKDDEQLVDPQEVMERLLLENDLFDD